MKHLNETYRIVTSIIDLAPPPSLDGSENLSVPMIDVMWSGDAMPGTDVVEGVLLALAQNRAINAERRQLGYSPPVIEVRRQVQFKGFLLPFQRTVNTIPILPPKLSV